MTPRLAPLLRRASTVANVVTIHVPSTPITAPIRLPPNRSFSGFQAPPRDAKPDQPHNELVGPDTGADTPMEQADQSQMEKSQLTVPKTWIPLSKVAAQLASKFAAQLAKTGAQAANVLEEHNRPVYQAGRAVTGAAVEKGRDAVSAARPPPTYMREAPPYQTLDKLYPGMMFEQTLEKVDSRAPQFHLTPEQFDQLSEANPAVGWISQNARFHRYGMCHGEAFAEVRRMVGGVSMDESRKFLSLNHFYPVPNDFKQRLETQDLAAILREEKVVVYTGWGQMVAGDSHLRLVESGNYDAALLHKLGEGAYSNDIAGRVGHSVILIHDDSGLIPEGHVIVYDMDPFCNRYENLHGLRTSIPTGQKTAPDPYFVPEGYRHHALRIVSFEGLQYETTQRSAMPKVMALRPPETRELAPTEQLHIDP